MMLHCVGGLGVIVRPLMVSPWMRHVQWMISFQMRQSLLRGEGTRGQVSVECFLVMPFKSDVSICVLLVEVRSDNIMTRAYMRHLLNFVICAAENFFFTAALFRTISIMLLSPRTLDWGVHWAKTSTWRSNAVHASQRYVSLLTGNSNLGSR